MSTDTTSLNTDGAYGASALENIHSILKAREVEVLCWENGYVRCPGIDLHTTANAESDCKIFFNEDGSVIAYCLHQSCGDSTRELNAALAEFRSLGGSTTPISTQVNTAMRMERWRSAERERERRKIKAMLPGILKDSAWPVTQIIAESPEKIDFPEKDHWKGLMVCLFFKEEILWCGRDEHDSGSLGHRWRFRHVGEWLWEPECPGAFICPHAFKPGVHSRANDNITTKKFLVVESDILSRNETGAIFRWLQSEADMCLRAVVDTAGKSLHGWFDYPPLSLLGELKTWLPALGCDPAMFTPSQPVRLPGALRNGRYQRLLYLNPNN